MSLQQKEKEIREFCIERLQEIADYRSYEDFTTADEYDLHNDIFNTDYYIIGRYQAKKWLDSDAFDCIGEIQEYENFNFGEVTTDFSEPERVVNMYVYIVGYNIIEECFKEVCETLSDQLDLLEEAG